jgi:flagellar hook assembly protein FlgD
MKHKIILPFLFVLLMTGFQSLSHATLPPSDVSAPSDDNVFTLTITNIGSAPLTNVNLETTIERNPDGLISIQSTTPENATIEPDATQAFEITFDVDCPPENVSKVELAKFKFSLSTDSQGPFYIEGCGIDTNDCEALEAEIAVLEENDICVECDENGNFQNVDCDDNDECTIDTCQVPDGCMHTHIPNCGDIDNSDPTYIQRDRSSDAPEVIHASEFFFSPVSSRTIKDQLEFSLEVLHNKAIISLRIYNNNMRPLQRIFSRLKRQMGKHTEIWNGQLNTGEVIADGTYLFNLEIKKFREPNNSDIQSGNIIVDDIEPLAKINYVRAHSLKSNIYTIYGTATDDHFNKYEVECFKENTYAHFVENSQPVIDNELASFDTASLEDGNYTLLLTASDFAGNTAACEMQLVIDKKTEIPTVTIDSVIQHADLASEGYVQTSDNPIVWIEDTLPDGSTELDTWQWDSTISYSGQYAHTDPAQKGTHGHYFIHANDTMSLSYRENIIQYVYLDPDDTPQQIMIQFYTDDGSTAHRAYWGSDRIECGRTSRSYELYRMGSLPPSGKWIRLKIPAYTIGLSGKDIKGMAFVTYDGKAWWDKTTKSDRYNENQNGSWMLASQIGEDDSTLTTITYTLSKATNLSLSIYNENNDFIQTIMDEYKDPGTYQVTWDSKNQNGDTISYGRYYFQFERSDGPLDSNAYARMPGDYSALTAVTYNQVTDSTGNYYSIVNNYSVEKFASSDAQLYSISAQTLGLDTFTPIALEMDTNNNLFILDGQQIYKLNAHGYALNQLPDMVNLTWTDHGINFNQATAMKIDSDGNLIVENENSNDIVKLNVARGVIDISHITAEIRVPYDKSLVSYSVPIIGTAAARSFSAYQVEYGAGISPTEWTMINTSNYETFDDHEPIPPSRTIYGNLATWHTAELVGWAGAGDTYNVPMGTYTIRLTVFNRNGEFKQDTVVVEMAKLIGSWRGTLLSDDGLVAFKYPRHAIPDDYDLFSIKKVDPANAPAVDDPELTLVGNIYQIKPAGYQFLKNCTLQMYYTDDQLGDIPEDTLKIYRWNPIIQKWIFVRADLNMEQKSLTTELKSFNDYIVYYAIISDPPPAPILFEPETPTNLRYISVLGNASPSVSVELFVNGNSQGTVQADVNTGNFIKSNVQLNLGDNQITAIASDPVGNTSPLSDPITVTMALAEPDTVTSVDFKTSDFESNYTGNVSVGDELLIELVGMDADSEMLDSATVVLKSSITDPLGISIVLLETDSNTGIYRGTGYVGETSNASNTTIGVSLAQNETITVYAVVDHSKTDTIELVDIIPPQAPEIVSSTHPSLCQNTFENQLDEWANMSNTFGAEVTRSSDTAKSGNFAVKLENMQEGGDFASILRSTPFDAHQYPMVQFDYKIPSDIKLNLIAQVNGMLKEIVFTDDPKTVETFEDDLYRPIGQIENVVNDNTWQHASFNLYNMLKADDPDQATYIVEEMYFADYNLPGWLELVMGEENAAGSYYFVDNFIISQGGKSNDDPIFTWAVDDPGVTGYSYELDQSINTLPDQVSEGNAQSVSYTDIDDGIWYFHVRAVDFGGNWGIANHYQIEIDTTGPVSSSPDPADGSLSGSLEVKLSISDSGSGVNPDTIQFQIKDTIYDITSGGIVFDELTGEMTFSLWKVFPIPDPWNDGETIQATLLSANDFAGNALQSQYTWQWTVDYSQLTGGYLSLLTTQGGQTPSWSYDESKIAFMSERSGNPDIWIIDATDYAEQNATTFQLTSYTSAEHHPSWSPVDNRIAFVSNKTGVDKIYVIDSNGSNLIQISQGTDVDSHPSWSPDGTQIVFSRLDEIWIADANGMQVTQVTKNFVEYYLEPVWAKSGDVASKIVFTKSLYVDEIAVMKKDGTDQAVISTSGSDMLPTWSESTSQVVFVTTRDNQTQALRIINENGSNEETYIDNEGRFWDSEPDLSPNSQNIAIQSTRNGTWNIWVKTQLQLTDVRAFPDNFSPNGDGVKDSVEIMFNVTGGTASIDVGIYDFENNLIMLLAESQMVYSLTSMTWFGNNANGDIVDDGTYTYKISVEGASIEKTGTIDIDNAAPFFTNWILLDDTLSDGAQSISATVADANDIAATRLQYGVSSSADLENPDIIGWTDFSDTSSGELDLAWDNYDGNYVMLRGYAEDNQGNIGYSDPQKKLIAYSGAPPDADAGLSRSVEENQTVILDASNSFDPDGQIVSYLWEQMDGDSVTLADANAVTTTFVAPPADVAGQTLTFKVTVTDNSDYENVAQVDIQVNDNGITGFPINARAVECATGKNAAIEMPGAGELIGLSLIDPDTLPDSQDKPSLLPYGLFDINIKVPVGGTAQVKFYFPEPLPSDHRWYKRNTDGEWYLFDQYVDYNPSRTEATLTIEDGGAGDDDGIANGFISDPSGPGYLMNVENVTAKSVPTMNEWGMFFFAGILLSIALRRFMRLKTIAIKS